jgi:hypothetical protein
MTKMLRTAVAVAGAALIAVPATAGIASGATGDRVAGGGGSGVRTVVEGLSGPRQLNDYRGDRLVVAESDSGEVSSVNLHTGLVRTLLDGLLSPQGVAYEDGLLYVAVGGPPPPAEETPTEEPVPSGTMTSEPVPSGTTTAESVSPTGTTTAESVSPAGTTTAELVAPTGTTTSESDSSTASTTSESVSPTETTTAESDTPTETTPPTDIPVLCTDPVAPTEPTANPASSALVIAEPGGPIRQTIDLEAYELKCNPDGQPQFDANGVPPDALSNPFAVFAQDRRVLVADAGANDVLSIDRRTGEISTFFVPERVSPADVEACRGANANPDTEGCDPVPTGIAEGPDGLLYVSTLGAEVAGAGRVYVLDQRGEQVDVIEGLTSPTGVEVDGRGRVYVSSVIEGQPEADPPPAPDAFDYSQVGELTRIDPDGSHSTADVTMPTGLHIEEGRLYASAWSIASFVPGLAESLGQPAGTPLGQVVRVSRSAFSPESSEPTDTASASPTDSSSAGPTDSSDPTDSATVSVPTTTTTAGG